MSSVKEKSYSLNTYFVVLTNIDTQSHSKQCKRYISAEPIWKKEVNKVAGCVTIDVHVEAGLRK